jgi:hypothetical protein
MVRVLAFCLAAGLILAPQALGATDPGAKDQPPVPTADEVLRQLSTGDWRQRQETIRRLVELGPAAQPVLRELAGRDLDREARKNVELAARRIDEARLFGPTLVTLHVTDAAPGQVFSDLVRQCAGPLPTWPDKLWDESNWPKLTLNYDRRPFWEVMIELGKRLQVDYITSDPQEIRIARDSGHSPGGMCVSGAFLVTADAMTFRSGMNVVVCVYGEPKITLTRAASFKLEQAEDDQGHPLLPQTSRRWWGRRFRTGSRQLPMLFQRPADDASKIGRLKGTLNVVIQTASDVWEVRDPASMSATTRLVDSVPVTIESFTASRTGGQGYELLITLPTGSSSRGTQDEISDLIRKRMTVLDANGHKLSLGMIDSRGTNDGAEITADFTPAPQPDGNRTGPPAKLLWDIPSETRECAVPFDFKSIPINDPFN